MNLIELEALIDNLMQDYEENVDLIKFYTEKRLILLDKIWAKVNEKLSKL